MMNFYDNVGDAADLNSVYVMFGRKEAWAANEEDINFQNCQFNLITPTAKYVAEVNHVSIYSRLVLSQNSAGKSQ